MSTTTCCIVIEGLFAPFNIYQYCRICCIRRNNKKLSGSLQFGVLLVGILFYLSFWVVTFYLYEYPFIAFELRIKKLIGILILILISVPVLGNASRCMISNLLAFWCFPSQVPWCILKLVYSFLVIFWSFSTPVKSFSIAFFLFMKWSNIWYTWELKLTLDQS